MKKLFDIPERTPREAIIALIKDMLEEEHGRDFVEAAVTAFAMQITARSKQRGVLGELEKEWLGFANQILSDEGGSENG